MSSKYFNKKTIYKGTVYDSRKEAKRAYELEMLQRAGYISNLQKQVMFELQPSFKAQGKTERAITYLADFYYFDNQKNIWIAEDVKSPMTRTLPVYRIKKKLFLFKYKDILFIET